MNLSKPKRSKLSAGPAGPAVVAAVAVACLWAGGCASMYRQDIASVAVPIFQRDPGVYRRGLEFRVTEALKKRIELDTPYKVTDKSNADTMLEGTIVSVNQRVLSFNPRLATPRDEQLRIVVRLKWTDLRSGEVLYEQRNLRASGVYYPEEPLNEEFFEGSASAINRLAQLIVETMEKPW